MPTINVQTGETTYTTEELEAMAAAAARAHIPKSITPRQCRLLLYQQGMLPQVEAMIAQSTDDVKITWEYALEFRRDDPLLNQLAANMQPPLAPEEIDQFFIAAAQL